MTSQPDNLFRDTLENFKRTAPAGAWDKIENNLAARNRSVVWLRIAAGVALLCAAAIVLWPAGKEKETITQSGDKIITPQHTVKQPVLNQQEEKEETSTSTITPAQQNHTSPVAKTEESVQKNILPVQDSVEVIPFDEPTPLVAEVAAPDDGSSKKIVYTAEEVNAKFLKKKLPPEATPDSKEASGIQKLIGLAYAAKNSEATLGDLRQKKDDILALNFGKNKVRTN